MQRAGKLNSLNGSNDLKGHSYTMWTFFDIFEPSPPIPQPHTETVHGPPTKFTQTCKRAGSGYKEATWSYNMSYEREFCGLSEYV